MKSILDNDLYKFTMQQAVLDHFPDAIAEGEYTDRRKTIHTMKFLRRLKDNIEAMEDCRLNPSEALWLSKNCPYLTDDYIAYLAKFRFDPGQLEIDLDKDGHLVLRVLPTLWAQMILWEVPLLATVSETYFQVDNKSWTMDGQNARSVVKIHRLAKCSFADFGTRRRRNFEVQDDFVNNAANQPGFVGTSNVFLARRYDCKPIGTMAHEWIMGTSAIDGLPKANYHALRRWAQTYRGDLGIALPDTYGMKAFYKDFDGELARLFDGVRWDSGSPYVFGEELIKHYQSLRINPLHKMAVFTNSLDTTEVIAIHKHFEGRIGVSAGIGTHFTNDFDNSPAMNIVFKLSKLNGVPLVKLSEDSSKAIGDKDALRVARWTFHGTPLDAQ